MISVHKSLRNGTTEIELIANPLLGVVLHWIGGLSSASFYVPYKGVRRWSWEIFWLTGGVFSWLIGPRSFAAFQTRALLAVATLRGILSSCFAYGAAAGAPIRALGAEAGTGSLWQGLPVLCVVLAGGFTTNCLWCLALIIKNRSGGEWVGRSAGTAGLPA